MHNGTSVEQRGHYLDSQDFLFRFWSIGTTIHCVLPPEVLLSRTQAPSVVYIFPALSSQYLEYGGRRDQKHDRRLQSPSTAPWVKPIDTIVGYQVPHSYFIHFYVVSVVFSLFWGYQILKQGSIIRAISSLSSTDTSGLIMSRERVILVWSLMTFQGCRRLFESMKFMKGSSATMPIAVYLLALLFYFALGISIWIEGSGQ